MPIINADRAAKYVTRKLQRSGFEVNDVSIAGTVCLHISWKHDKNTMLNKMAQAL
jgi:hypothetical protein